MLQSFYLEADIRKDLAKSFAPKGEYAYVNEDGEIFVKVSIVEDGHFATKLNKTVGQLAEREQANRKKAQEINKSIRTLAKYYLD